MAAGRVELPQEFYDKMDDRLLIQPQPQWFYSELFLGALAVSLSGADFTLPWRNISMSTGGTQYGSGGLPADADRLRLSSPLMTDVFSAKVDFTAAPGNTVRINRPAYATTTYTEASRRIPLGGSISTTPAPQLKSEQVNMTLFRYGGPYDTTNSRVAPMAIEAFDTQMGVHKLVQIAENTLVRDFHAFTDAVPRTLLDLASTKIYPEGMTADNDATTKGSFPFTYEQLLRAERTADDANLPTFADGYRVAVLHPTQVMQLGLDPIYAKASQFHPLYNMLFPQYVKSVSKTHIFKSTTLTSTANTSSVSIKYGHYIAPGALMAGMGRRPQVRPSTDDNYGETAKVIWLADLAFGLADDRLVLSLRSSEDAA